SGAFSSWGRPAACQRPTPTRTRKVGLWPTAGQRPAPLFRHILTNSANSATPGSRNPAQLVTKKRFEFSLPAGSGADNFDRAVPGSVVLSDDLIAGAGAQGLQGGQREAVAQEVDRAVRHDDVRPAPVAAAVRPQPFVLHVAARRAKRSRKRPGYIRRREY